MIVANAGRTPDKLKRIGRLLIPLLILAPPLQGEVVTLADSGCTLDLQVLEITENRLTAHMKRTDIARLHLGVAEGEAFGDRVLSRRCNAEFKVKLLAMSEESATLLLPREIIAVVEASAGQEAAAGANIGATALQTKANRLAQLEARLEMARDKKQAKDKERLFEPDIDGTLFGSLSGRLLAGGMPYRDAPVKIRRLPTESAEGDTKTRPQLFDAVTDSQGIYRFERLPDGPYDIYWIPPERTYWVRMLREKPTTAIRAGQHQTQPDIDADMMVLN